MLTILSHLIFWPALIWNVFLFITVIASGGISRHNMWSDIKAIAVSLAILLIPGVYLFGIW
jgi:hypothetical protein